MRITLILLLVSNVITAQQIDNRQCGSYTDLPFFNVSFMILIQTIVIKVNSDYLYVVPLSILPIILKAFFDARLGLFTHVLTVLLLGFIVPDSFEFIYLHIIAGIVTILTVSELKQVPIQLKMIPFFGAIFWIRLINEGSAIM